MTQDYRFQTTIEPSKLRQVLALAGTEWSGKLSAEEFADVEAKSLVDFVLKGNPGRAFYLETKQGEILASCVVTQHKALYKEAGVSTIGTVPDPGSFGVNNITAIRLSYVFVAKEARGKGLMGRLVPKAIEYTEKEILKKELAKHYLGKKYVWYLYSAIDSAYTKFGFKAYPIEGYKISQGLAEGKTYSFVEKLLTDKPKDSGKKLRLLDGTKQQDRDLIHHILQGKQLELLTDLNKNVYHSELQGDSRSSSSLTNLSSALSSSRPNSSKELHSINMKFRDTVLGSPAISQSSTSESSNSIVQERRKSSILSLGCPKFAILPDIIGLDQKFAGGMATAEKIGTEENKTFAKYYGAILTNELQRRSFYVLWMLLKGTQFTIVAMGELKIDLFGAMADPLGLTNTPERRRSASFTGINEMGGFNFQDLDLLVNVAVHVAQKSATESQDGSVLVNINDLPTSIPRPVLHDFFLNYLTKEHKTEVNTQPANEEAVKAVQYLETFADLQILPMLKKYGNQGASFELDWVANSLVTWG
ncbi:hypothetical protein OXX79_009217 [Metschnikowia pulcherrima]